MKLHEYQAKHVFADAGIPTPGSALATTADEVVEVAEDLGYPVAVKAQVHVGGRGKAGVRLLTETIAEENRGEVRANAVMPSVIDTPQNREMLPDADHDAWVDPADIARVVLTLCSDATPPTSGGAIPVYGEA